MRRFVAFLACLALVSCGTVYKSQRVVSGATDAATVRVLPVTAQSVMIANRSSYSPKTLPQAFFANAGTGSGLRGAGALPEPSYTAQTRPGALETRLPPAVPTGPYRIGVGDVVNLATSAGSSVEELSGLLAAQNKRQGYVVQDDGSIAIPDVGRVNVAGLSLEEAEDVLFQRLLEAQIEPSFSLEIAEFNSKRVSVGGAVANPGVLPITLTPLYLDEALASVGGSVAADMDYASVRIYRDGSLYQIPLDTLYRNHSQQRIQLQAGDSVFVDTAYELDQAEAYFAQQIALQNARLNARSTALANLRTEVELRRSALEETRSNYLSRLELDAVDRDYVYLTGEVERQGRYPLPMGRKATLADALYETGEGLARETADPRHIYVLRGSDDPMEFDSLTAWKLDAKNAAGLMLATRFELRPNDVVFVAEQPVTRWHRTIQQITPSLFNVGATLAN